MVELTSACCGDIAVSVVLPLRCLWLSAVTRRDPEAGAVGQDGRGHRDHPAALPQPPGEEPRPALHAQVSHVNHNSDTTARQ